MSKKFQLETKNLILRHMTHDDLDDMFELDSDPLVHKYLGNNPLTSKKQSEAYIQSNIDQRKERGIARWVTIEKATGDFIGWSGLRLNSDLTFNNTTNFYDVGYRFIPRYWGKGYATEASFLALDYFFNSLKKDLLCGIAEVDNIASNRVLTKIGLQFKEEFILDNTKENWYELKREDYAKTVS